MECPSASPPCPHLNIKFSISGHNQGNQSTLRTPATPSKSCLALKRLQKASKVSENETVLQNCFNLISIFLPPKGRMKLQVSQTYRIVLKQDCQSCHIGKLGQALPARHLELCNTFSLFWENSDTQVIALLGEIQNQPQNHGYFLLCRKPHKIKLVCLMWCSHQEHLHLLLG